MQFLHNEKSEKNSRKLGTARQKFSSLDFAASILLQLCQEGEKGRKSLNKGGKDVSQSNFATNISLFVPLGATNLGEWVQKLTFVQ